MLGRVLIFRIVATTYMSARETHPQTHPGIPCFYAVLADGDVLWMNNFYLIPMSAKFLWHDFLSQAGKGRQIPFFYLVNACRIDHHGSVAGPLNDIREFCADDDLIKNIRMARVYSFRKILIDRRDGDQKFHMHISKLLRGHSIDRAILHDRIYHRPIEGEYQHRASFKRYLAEITLPIFVCHRKRDGRRGFDQFVASAIDDPEHECRSTAIRRDDRFLAEDNFCRGV